MLPDQQEALLANYVLLVQNVRVHNIQMYLIQYGVLTLPDAEFIKAKTTAQDKIESLLMFLTNSDRPSVFDHLLEALEEGDYGFVADKIKSTITNIRRRRKPLRKLPNVGPDEHPSTPETFIQRLRSMRQTGLTSRTEEKAIDSGNLPPNNAFFPSHPAPYYPEHSPIEPNKNGLYDNRQSVPNTFTDAHERFLWNATDPRSVGSPMNPTGLNNSMSPPWCTCGHAGNHSMHAMSHLQPYPHSQPLLYPNAPAPHFSHPYYNQFHTLQPPTGVHPQYNPYPNSTSLCPPSHSPSHVLPSHSPRLSPSPLHPGGCGPGCRECDMMSRLRLNNDEKRDLDKDNLDGNGRDGADAGEEHDSPTPLVDDRRMSGCKTNRPAFPNTRRSIDAGRVSVAGARQALIQATLGSATAREAVGRNAESLSPDEKLVFIERERDQGFGFRLREMESNYFLVDEVEAHSVAYMCGAFCQGDVITCINGIDATSLEMSQAVDSIRNTNIQLILKIQHAGMTHVVIKSVKLNATRQAPCGFKLISGRERPRFPGDSCFYVTKVYPNTLAWRQGVLVGDVIVSVNGAPLNDLTYDEMLELLRLSVEREEGQELVIHRFEYTSPTL